MIRLFIENKELDINDSLSHQITYAVDDLKNLDAKATSFSKTLIIPGTANNNRLFGNIFQFSNSNFYSDGPNVGYNFNASKSAKALLQSNGLTIIKGVLRLLEVIIDGESIEYEVAIFGELGGFINKLANKKLEDLDFNNYQHTYTAANIKNSWSLSKTFSRTAGVGELTFFNKYLYIYAYDFYQLEAGDSIVITGTSGGTNNGTYIIDNVTYDANEGKTVIVITTSFPTGQNTSGTIAVTKRGYGYYYPLIDYGNQSTNKKDYQYKTFRPALFVKEYITRIVRDAGYTYNSNFFKSDFFTRLIIPHNDKLLYKYNLSSYGTATKNTSQTVTSGNQETTTIVTFNSASLTSFNFISSTYFSALSNCTVNISMSIAIHTNNSNFGNARLVLRKNTSNGYQDFTIVETLNGLGSFKPGRFNYNLITSLSNGDNFLFVLIVQKGESFFGNAQHVIDGIDIQIDKSPAGLLEYSLNDTLKVNDAIPRNILQKDFFTSILKMFNLMVTEDKLIDRRLNIEPWVGFYNLDRTTYQDWTNKIDRNNVIKIKPMSEINSRYYNFKFKSDSDYYNELYKKKYNEGYGDMTFDNKLDFAKDSSSSEVIFSASPLIGWSGEDKILPVIFKWDGVTKGVNEEAISSNIRIMQCKPVSGITSWKILDGVTNLSSGTTYGYAGHFDSPDAPNADINFGATNELYFTLVTGGLQNNMFNAYYSSYMAEITDKDSRLVTAKIKLLEKDIYNLDFGKFIFVDGVLYRLQKIIDYSAGDICTVELLRVIYTQY
jgi:hypothetical protein